MVTPPSLAPNHQHPHHSGEERRGGRPRTHHHHHHNHQGGDSNSSSSVIPPITLEGRGQWRTLRARRLPPPGGRRRPLSIDLNLPTLLLLLLLLVFPVNSAVLILAASSLPQSKLTHPICKSLTAGKSLCNQPAAGFCFFSPLNQSGRVNYSGFEGSAASGLSFSIFASAIVSYAPLF